MHVFFYKVNDKEYRVVVTYKKIKKIYYRFYDDEFRVSCPKLVSDKKIKQGLDKFGLSLINRSNRLHSGEGEDYIYLLGVKVPIQEEGEIVFINGDKIVYSSKEERDKKLKKFFLNFVTERVIFYTQKMNVPLYKVKVRDMKSRVGSNSKYTKSLCFATSLMHYAKGTIDSVVVHELAHILVYDHSKKFYDIVYKYCPDYDIYRKKILKRDFS